MPTAQEINIKIGATDEASAVFARVANNAKKLQGGNVFQRIGEGARSLEAQFGEERGVRKLLQGGLIGFFAAELGKLGQEIEKTSVALREGSMNWQQMTNSILESIPVFGGFYQFGLGIRELFTGEIAADVIEAKKIAAESNRRRQEQDRFFKFRGAKESAQTSLGELIAQNKANRSMIGLSGSELESAQIDAQFQKALRDAEAAAIKRRQSFPGTSDPKELDTIRSLVEQERQAAIEKANIERQSAIDRIDQQNARRDREASQRQYGLVGNDSERFTTGVQQASIAQSSRTTAIYAQQSADTLKQILSRLYQLTGSEGFSFN